MKKGMDAERVEALVRRLRIEAGVINGVVGAVDGAVNALANLWFGENFGQFHSAWIGGQKSQAQSAALDISTVLSLLEAEVSQQRSASAGQGGQTPGLKQLAPLIPTADQLAQMSAKDRAQAISKMSARDAEAALLAMTPAMRAATLAAMDPGKARALIKGMPTQDADATYAALMALSPKALAKVIGNDIVAKKIEAEIEAHAEVLSWKVEGKASASYQVNGDGSVTLDLRLEDGLGKYANVPGGEVSATAGATEEYQLKFASVDEMNKFLSSLHKDLTSPGSPDHLAHNVAATLSHVQDASVIYGIYGKVDGTLKVPGLAEITGGGRVDITEDPLHNQQTVQFHTGGSATVPGATGSAQIDGQVQVTNGQISQLQLTTTVAGQAGLTDLAPGLHGTVGGSSQVQVTIGPDDPGYAAVMNAAQHGDMTTALHLAAQSGEVTVTSSVVSTVGGTEEISTPVASAGYHYDVTTTTATNVWVKPAGGDQFYDISKGVPA